MCSGRMRGHIEALGIAPEPLRILVDPGDAASHLVNHRGEANIRQLREIQDRSAEAGRPETLGRKAVIILGEVLPGAAVHKDLDWGIFACRREEIEHLVWMFPITQIRNKG